MPESPRNLPDFEVPPVVETLLSVEFSPLSNWDIRHFGLLWEAVRNVYPNFEVQPPLASPDRVSPEAELARNLLISVVGSIGPLVRAWYIDESRTRLLQVQEDRFIHNWRKVSGGEEYPHYEDSIRPTFETAWQQFCSFVSTHNIEQPRLERWEVTYVNHLEKGKEWETLEDLAAIFPIFQNPQHDRFLSVAETIRYSAVFPFPVMDGRLHLNLQPVVRSRDSCEILQLTLTARGTIPDEVNLMTCFDLGREWVVRGFTDITSERAHLLWKRRERI